MDPQMTLFSPSCIAIAGDSAGGGLTVAVLLALREAHIQQPAAAVCLSPWLDLKHSMGSFQTNARFDYLPDRVNDPVLNSQLHYYAPNEELENPFVSPLYCQDLGGLAPILIVRNCWTFDRHT